jgi:hypothetical protein
VREIPRGHCGGRVNKWMVRFWGLLALVSLAMLIATTAWPAIFE